MQFSYHFLKPLNHGGRPGGVVQMQDICWAFFSLHLYMGYQTREKESTAINCEKARLLLRIVKNKGGKMEVRY